MPSRSSITSFSGGCFLSACRRFWNLAGWASIWFPTALNSFVFFSTADRPTVLTTSTTVFDTTPAEKSSHASTTTSWSCTTLMRSAEHFRKASEAALDMSSVFAPGMRNRTEWSGFELRPHPLPSKRGGVRKDGVWVFGLDWLDTWTGFWTSSQYETHLRPWNTLCIDSSYYRKQGSALQAPRQMLMFQDHCMNVTAWVEWLLNMCTCTCCHPQDQLDPSSLGAGSLPGHVEWLYFIDLATLVAIPCSAIQPLASYIWCLQTEIN